jgi:6-phosphogluconolactonase
MQIQVYESTELQIIAAADLLLDIATEAISKRDRFSLVLSGGSTPVPLYRRLTEPPYSESVPWQKAQIFWGDERCVLPTNSESNFGQASALLLKPNQIRPNQIHRIQGELQPRDAAKQYSAELASFFRSAGEENLFDIVFLGLGADGHVASLFPGSAAEEGSKEFALAVRARYEGRPSDRVTMTARSLNRARNVIVLVSGSEKSKAVYDAVHGEHDPLRYPAQRIKPATGEVYWILDREAGQKIQTLRLD